MKKRKSQYVCWVRYPGKYYYDEDYDVKIGEVVGRATETGMSLNRGKPQERDLGFIRKTKSEANLVATRVKALKLSGVKTKVEAW